MSKSRVVDFSKSLNELQGFEARDPDKAPTPLMRDILCARSKPLGSLVLWEIARLVVQRDGFPYILDRVMPMLEADPLLDGGYYPGDILSNLIRAEAEIWQGRPDYELRMPELYRRALSQPLVEKGAFLDSLGIADDSNAN